MRFTSVCLYALCIITLSGCDHPRNGWDGRDGTDGFTILIKTERLSTDSVTCASLAGVLISSGLDTNRDSVLNSTEIDNATMVCDGDQGEKGSDGESCTVSLIQPSSSFPTGGSQLTCGSQSVVVINGAVSGTAAAYSVAEHIAPCGASSSPWKEVLLRLADGSLIASFSENSSGKNTRLSLIPDGTYANTDSSGCVFTVSTNGSTRSISWNAGSNQYSSWTASSHSWTLF